MTRFAVRLVAVFNSLLVAAGLIGAAFAWWKAYLGSPKFSALISDTPYFWDFFAAYSAMSLLIISALAVSSYLLFKGRRLGLYVFLGILLVEFVYWHLLGPIASSPTFGMSSAAATGIGNMGLSLHPLVGYPTSGLCVVAMLLVLNRWRPTLT